MVFGMTQILQRSPVRWQLVGDEEVRSETLFLQQFAYQPERSLLVPARLNQDIKHLTLAIHRPPQNHALAVDRHEHFVEVPPGV